MNRYQLTEEELLEELRNRMLQCKNNLRQLQELNEELKKANIKLSESEALKSHFLSNVTNEIVNPFASILGLSKAIMEIKDFNKTRSMAQLIYNEAFNLDFQLKNIFAAAKVEAGQTNVEINNVDISGVINSVIDTYKHKAEQKNLTVNFEYHVSEEVDNNFIFPTLPDLIISSVGNVGLIVSFSTVFTAGTGLFKVFIGSEFVSVSFTFPYLTLISDKFSFFRTFINS